MFASILIFMVTLTQLVLVGLSYYKQWWELFAVSFYQLSPVMVFLGVLNFFGIFNGEVSGLLWVGFAFCMIKYFILARALVGEELNFFNVSALLGEVLLLAGSSWYIISYSYF